MGKWNELCHAYLWWEICHVFYIYRAGRRLSVDADVQILINWIYWYVCICCTTYVYILGICWGDPHIRTLDNLNFTFNGLGEYTLLQVRTENVTFDIQGRTSRPMQDNGKYSKATIFSAFAAVEGPTGARIHFELDDRKSGVCNTVLSLSHHSVCLSSFFIFVTWRNIFLKYKTDIHIV